MNNPLAIVIGAIIIAAAILIVFRWQLTGPGSVLLDRWTGTVVQCAINYSGPPPGKLDCKPR
jgi:hypothetical protein